MEFYAHTKNEDGEWHYLKEHLIAVADLAKENAKGFYKGHVIQLAELIGLFHDLGKVHPGFQDYLIALDAGDTHNKVPHSPWSSRFVYLTQNNSPLRHVLGLPVAGHHSGMNEPGNVTVKLKNYDQEQEMVNQMATVAKEITEKRLILPVKIPSMASLQIELLIRMLFSALIDADRLDTEAHMAPHKTNLRVEKASLEQLAVIYREKQKAFVGQNVINNPTLVNGIRKNIYEECLTQAISKPGLFRLTVPTGGGKTRSALAFALEHAINNGQQRIIIALPYTSIIDQTAQVYREIFGEYAVLEHHSQLEIKDNEEQNKGILRLRLAEENWDMPLIVTTTVQLLESLFSNHPSRCRKLHNISQSVIIFDEAQTMPVELLKPTFQVIRDLIENYGSTVVLSTATQPSLQGAFLHEFAGMDIKEIVPDYERNFKDLTRVRYSRIPKPVSMEELAREISKHSQVLVIMNTRKQAIGLVKALNSDGCMHLSTLLCGMHRRQILKEVRKRLDDKMPIRLISTQVVEAGVDLDFPVVYRILGPLDRIAQAAGRCNREGIMDYGNVMIFELTDEQSPRGSYKAGLEMAKLILAESDSPDILNNPSIFQEYFSRLYNTMGNDLDKYEVQKIRKQLNYPKTAEVYRLINQNTVSVVVRYGKYNRPLNEWLKYPDRVTWRKLQPYLVNIYEWESRNLFRNGLLTELTKGLYIWEGVYDKLTGISAVESDPADYIV